MSEGGADRDADRTAPWQDQPDRAWPPPPQQAPELQPGDRIGPCQIIERIGSGGMGAVYLARQDRPRRIVAVKVIRPGMVSDGAMERFRFEPEFLGQARGEHLVTIHLAGTATVRGVEVPFFVMEHVPGARSLIQYAREEDLDTSARLRLFAGVCDAVQECHRAGLIHRDLKPENILIDDRGRPRVIDFGVALTRAPDLRQAFGSEQGRLIGTVRYMSPEQTIGDPGAIDARSDVYTLGVILYELLTGAMPYGVSMDDSKSAVEAICHREPVRPRRVCRRVRGDIERIVLKALRKEPDGRFQSASALGANIRAYLAGQPVLVDEASPVYMARMRGRRWIARQHVAAHLGAVLLTAILVATLAKPIIFRLTPVNTIFERWATGAAAPWAGPTSMDAVRLVTISDLSAASDLADRIDAGPLDPSNFRTFRPLYGRLMERLARARPRVVIWDLSLTGPTPGDDVFVQGVRALGAVGAEVIVGHHTWSLDEQGLPEQMPPAIAPEVRWAGMTAGMDADGPWWLDIVVVKEDTRVIPSLALAGLAAYREPGSEPSILVDRARDALTLRYWRRRSDVPSARGLVSPPERVPLSELRALERDEPEHGLKRGELIGDLLIQMPPTSVIDAATHDLGEVMRASDELLGQWFDGSAIVVGFSAPGIDERQHPDGRMIHGCVLHAVGLETLINGGTLRLPRNIDAVVIDLFSAALGVLAGAWLGLRRGWLLAALTIIGAAWIAASLLALNRDQYLLNPVVPVVGTLLGGLLSSTIARVRHGRPDT